MQHSSASRFESITPVANLRPIYNSDRKISTWNNARINERERERDHQVRAGDVPSAVLVDRQRERAARDVHSKQALLMQTLECEEVASRDPKTRYLLSSGLRSQRNFSGPSPH